MEPHHFDATTQFIDGKRGGKQKKNVVLAARAVLVEGKSPGAALEEYRDVDGSTLSKALKRYPKEFEQMVKLGHKVVKTVVVSPAYAPLLDQIDAAELEEIVQRVASKKKKPSTD